MTAGDARVEINSTEWLTRCWLRIIFNHMVESFNTDLDSVFHALSDATRRGILSDVMLGEKTVGEIAAPYAMSLAAVSKHLDVLERAHLVERERRGSKRMVKLKAEPMRAAQQWLAYYENFWQGRLDALQTQLEAATPEEDGK